MALGGVHQASVAPRSCCDHHEGQGCAGVLPQRALATVRAGELVRQRRRRLLWEAAEGCVLSVTSRHCSHTSCLCQRHRHPRSSNHSSRGSKSMTSFALRIL